VTSSGTLQARLGDETEPSPAAAAPDDGARTPPPVSDPVALLRHLVASGRFHQDSGFGRIFHPGKASFRENLPTDSLHLLVQGNRLAAHVDRVSPLGIRPERPSRYSLRRATAHNVAGALEDAVRLLRGRQGDHRSRLDCEWLWSPLESRSDDRDLLPPVAWSVHLEARVGGRLDEARLRRALACVVSRRPVTRDPFDVVDCPDDAALDDARVEQQSRRVPVGEWPPLRARLARNPAGDVLMLNVNHAAGDGSGALHVLRSIAGAYADDDGCERPLEFPAVDDLPVRPASAPVSPLVGRGRALVERLRDALSRPARLAPEHPDAEAGYGYRLVRLAENDTARVVDADRPGSSRNALVAALHLAIGDWNLAHGTPGRSIGVLVPVNLRPPDWHDDTVGNFSVTARISTSRRHRSGPGAARRAVTAQTSRNKRTRTGIALVAALDRSGLLPLWAKQSLVVIQPLTANHQVDTALLSNLGPLDPLPRFGAEAGDAVEVWFSAPARTAASLCVGAVTLAGRMHLVLRYPHRLFGADAAGRFADCLVAQIRLVGRSRDPV